MQLISVIAIIALLILAIAMTVAVGVSKENKEGNPAYEQKTKGNMTRLTLFYFVTGVAAFIAITVFVIQ